MFEEGKNLARKAATSASKDDLVAEKIFDTLSSRGYSSKKGLRGRGEGDYHYRRFDPPTEGLKPIEVKVTRLNKPGQQPTSVIGKLDSIAKTIGPQRVKIEFAVIEKEGGTLGLGKSAKKFEYTLNADDHIDNDLKLKNESSFMGVIIGYLKTIGVP
ncbi:hypothetical protein E2P71_03885, partial [Candidatus Bathyarchaeota archaeon]